MDDGKAAGDPLGEVFAVESRTFGFLGDRWRCGVFGGGRIQVLSGAPHVFWRGRAHTCIVRARLVDHGDFQALGLCRVGSSDTDMDPIDFSVLVGIEFGFHEQVVLDPVGLEGFDDLGQSIDEDRLGACCCLRDCRGRGVLGDAEALREAHKCECEVEFQHVGSMASEFHDGLLGCMDWPSANRLRSFQKVTYLFLSLMYSSSNTARLSSSRCSKNLE